MNMEVMKRLREAKKYQKMALQALLPDEAREHVDVIEKEMSAMFKECFMGAADCVRENAAASQETKVKAHKVNIE